MKTKYWVVNEKEKKLELSDVPKRPKDNWFLYSKNTKMTCILKYSDIIDHNGKLMLFGELCEPDKVELLTLKELRKKPLYSDFDEEKDILWFSDIEDTLPDPWKSYPDLPPIIWITCAQIIKYPNGYMLSKQDHQKKRNIIREIWATIERKNGDITVGRADELLRYCNYSFEDVLNPMYIHSDDWVYDIKQDEVPIFTRAVLNLYAKTQTELRKYRKEVEFKSKIKEILTFAEKKKEITSHKANDFLNLVGKSVFDVFKPGLLL
nr:MAG TPA: hypothetical protein [Caudoviricetes sp.]